MTGLTAVFHDLGDTTAEGGLVREKQGPEISA